jgi:hypothetical protein
MGERGGVERGGAGGGGKGDGASFVTNKGSPSGSKGSAVLAPGRWLRKVKKNKSKNPKRPLYVDFM